MTRLNAALAENERLRGALRERAEMLDDLAREIRTMALDERIAVAVEEQAEMTRKALWAGPSECDGERHILTDDGTDCLCGELGPKFKRLQEVQEAVVRPLTTEASVETAQAYIENEQNIERLRQYAHLLLARIAERAEGAA